MGNALSPQDAIPLHLSKLICCCCAISPADCIPCSGCIMYAWDVKLWNFLLWVVFVNRANRVNSHDNFTPKKMMSHIWPTNFSLLKGFCSVVYIWPSSLMSTITMPFLSFQNSCSDAQEWRVKHSSDRALGTVNCSGPPLMDNSVQRWWWCDYYELTQELLKLLSGRWLCAEGAELAVWAIVVKWGQGSSETCRCSIPACFAVPKW